MVICVMCVYNEEKLLPRALKSLEGSGVGRIVVFDGAWQGFGDGPSTDRTVEIAREAGCEVWEVDEPWESQEYKRTFMFHNCGAQQGDYIFVFDADEELEGKFTALVMQEHHNIQVKCVGENDLPGIRGIWPAGDYAPYYKPELRIFSHRPNLHCLWPGGYWVGNLKIKAYTGICDSRLPIAPTVSLLHHGNDREPERKQQKIDYYEVEHPKRVERQSKT